MTPFSILAPHLPDEDARLLRVAIQAAGLPWTAPTDALSSTHVLSVGKAGLDVWHDFGLIQVGANHGDTFTHRARNGRRHVIMVVEHPSAMRQLSAFGKYSAREDMVKDLTRWHRKLTAGTDLRPGNCGGCMKSRDSRVRSAEWWVEELDGVGLCDDHYRKRGKYQRKNKVVPVKDRGKIEHQITGQREMFGGDGTRVMVDKG